MEETGDFLEDSWFFGNLLHTKTRTISRCYSDLAFSSSSPIHTHPCPHPHPHNPLNSTQEHVVKIEHKNSSFSSRKQPPVAPISLTRTPSMPSSMEAQSFLIQKPDPDPNLMPFVEGSDQESVTVNKERKSSSFSSRKQRPVTPISPTQIPSLPNSIETQSFLMKKPDPDPNVMSSLVGSDQEDTSVKNERKSSSFYSRKPGFLEGSDQEDVFVKSERKSSNFSSRKQRPVAPLSLTRTPSLPNSMETHFFLKKNTNPNPSLTRTSSMSTSIDENDQDDEEEEEDQESEFTLGRLIRQASMNYSHTSNPPQQTSKVMPENTRKQPVLDQEKSNDMKKMERNKSKNTKNSAKNKNGGGAPTIPGGLIDKTSSDDMKAHIKFWARAVASNVRQECS